MTSAPLTLQHVATFFQGALECSLVLAPREPGLTYQELVEVGRRCGFKDGEMNDVLHRATNYAVGSRRLLPDKGTLELFMLREDPELRNFGALDFVFSEMNNQMAEAGGRAARLDRDVVVERGVSQDFPRNDLDAAITLLVWADIWVEKDGVLSSRHGIAYKPLPTEQRDQPGAHRQVTSVGAARRRTPLCRTSSPGGPKVGRRTQSRSTPLPNSSAASAIRNIGSGGLKQSESFGNFSRKVRRWRLACWRPLLWKGV